MATATKTTEKIIVPTEVEVEAVTLVLSLTEALVIKTIIGGVQFSDISEKIGEARLPSKDVKDAVMGVYQALVELRLRWPSQ